MRATSGTSRQSGWPQRRIETAWGLGPGRALYWFKRTDFEKWAHMSKPTCLAAINELKAAGFVTTFRPSVLRLIEGRRRAIPGAVQYTLHRQPKPKTDPKAPKSSKVKVDLDLRKSTSFTVKELDPEFSQTAPSAAAGLGRGLTYSENSSGGDSHRHHHHEKRDEDDETSPNSFQTQKQVNPLGNGPLEGNRLSPKLNSWVNSRILSRAQGHKRNSGGEGRIQSIECGALYRLA